MGFILAGAAALESQFGEQVREHMGEDRNGRMKRLYQNMHQVPIAPPQLIPAGGTGVITTVVDQLGPNTGFHWSVRRLAATGYTAGTINVYRNATQTGFGSGAAALTGEILFTFPQAGTFTFGRGEILLEPDDALVISGSALTLSAGVTGVTIYGSADQFPSILLPEYLM